MGEPGRQQLALPFAGDYVGVPRRNYFKLGAAFYWAGLSGAGAAVSRGDSAADARERQGAQRASDRFIWMPGDSPQARSFLERAVAANPAAGRGMEQPGRRGIGGGQCGCGATQLPARGRAAAEGGVSAGECGRA